MPPSFARVSHVADHSFPLLLRSYLVLLAGFYFAPYEGSEEASWPLVGDLGISSLTGGAAMDPMSVVERVRAGFKGLWAY